MSVKWSWSRRLPRRLVNSPHGHTRCGHRHYGCRTRKARRAPSRQSFPLSEKGWLKQGQVPHKRRWRHSYPRPPWHRSNIASWAQNLRPPLSLTFNLVNPPTWGHPGVLPAAPPPAVTLQQPRTLPPTRRPVAAWCPILVPHRCYLASPWPPHTRSLWCTRLPCHISVTPASYSVCPSPRHPPPPKTAPLHPSSSTLTPARPRAALLPTISSLSSPVPSRQRPRPPSTRPYRPRPQNPHSVLDVEPPVAPARSMTLATPVHLPRPQTAPVRALSPWVSPALVLRVWRTTCLISADLCYLRSRLRKIVRTFPSHSRPVAPCPRVPNRRRRTGSHVTCSVSYPRSARCPTASSCSPSWLSMRRKNSRVARDPTVQQTKQVRERLKHHQVNDIHIQVQEKIKSPARQQQIQIQNLNLLFILPRLKFNLFSSSFIRHIVGWKDQDLNKSWNGNVIWWDFRHWIYRKLSFTTSGVGRDENFTQIMSFPCNCFELLDLQGC